MYSHLSNKHAVANNVYVGWKIKRGGSINRVGKKNFQKTPIIFKSNLCDLNCSNLTFQA